MNLLPNLFLLYFVSKIDYIFISKYDYIFIINEL